MPILKGVVLIPVPGATRATIVADPDRPEPRLGNNFLTVIPRSGLMRGRPRAVSGYAEPYDNVSRVGGGVIRSRYGSPPLDRQWGFY
jgi:hypothetical protein